MKIFKKIIDKTSILSFTFACIAIACILLNAQNADAAVKKKVANGELMRCTGSGTLTIGKKVNSIPENYKIWTNADIKKIVVSSDNKKYTAIDGVLYNKKKTVLIYYPKNKTGKTFKVPNSVKKIAGSAFSYNKNLKKIIIPNGVTAIHNSAFVESNAQTVTIPKTVKTFGDCLFYNCSKLKTVENKAVMTEIPYGTFVNCQNLEGYTIDCNVINIGSNAFSNCKNLGNVTIPKSVKVIGENAFKESASYFDVDKENEYYSSSDGVLFSKDGKRLEYYPVNKEGDYIIPDIVEEIADTAFTGSIGLTGLTLNETIKDFAVSLLERCYNLQKLNISACLENLDLNKNTFNGRYYTDCYNLKEINAADTNKKFKSYKGALYSYDYKDLYLIPFGADKLILHENVQNINEDMCRNNFNSIEIPVTNKYYAEYNGVLYDNNITKIVIFPGKITDYNVPSSVKDISAIMNQFGSEEMIEEPLKYNNMAYNLQNITVEESNPYFSAEDGILYNKDMTRLLIYPQMKAGCCNIPATVKEVNIGAFASAAKLTEIKFSENMQYANIIVIGCTSLKTIICNNEMETLRIYGKYRFGEQLDLNIEEIYLPGNLLGITISGINKSAQFYGYNNTGEYTEFDTEINGIKSYLEDSGYKYKSLGSAPTRVTGAKAVINKSSVSISWDKKADAEGYIIFVKNNQKKYILKDIKNGNKKSCTINKNAFENIDNYDEIIDGIIIDENGNDTHYMFIRAYKIINGVKVYGKTTHIKV